MGQDWRDALYGAEAPHPAYLTMLAATTSLQSRFSGGESVSPEEYLPQRGELASTLGVEIHPDSIGEVGWVFDEGNQAPYLVEVFDTPLPEGRLPHVRVDRTWPHSGSYVVRILGRQHSFVKRLPANNKLVLFTAGCVPCQQLLVPTLIAG